MGKYSNNVTIMQFFLHVSQKKKLNSDYYEFQFIVSTKSKLF